MFQNLLSSFDYNFRKEVEKNGTNRVKEKLKGMFLENFATRSKQSHYTGDPEAWFDDELKSNLGVDVYEHKFDAQAGYMIISSPRSEVLVIRMEDLNRCVGDAMKDFLNLDAFELAPDNVGSDKEYGDVYKEVVDELKLRGTISTECTDRNSRSTSTLKASAQHFGNVGRNDWPMGLAVALRQIAKSNVLVRRSKTLRIWMSSKWPLQSRFR